MGCLHAAYFFAFCQTRKWKVALHLVPVRSSRKRRVPVDTEHAWLLRVPASFI